MPSYTLQAKLCDLKGTHDSLVAAVSVLFPFDFVLTCNSPRNNYQLNSDFDDAFSHAAQAAGWEPTTLLTPPDIARAHDGYFKYGELSIVVEIEKTNWEKFLYDLLKCHIYISSGANGCIILLPVNWPHKNGIKNIYHDCIPRLDVATKYHAIRPDVLGSLVVVGFEQMYEGVRFNSEHRQSMRADCRKKYQQVVNLGNT